MKLNKTIGRVATTLVATAMLASLAAPAYAAGVSGSGNETTPVSVVSVTKKLTTDGNTFAPNTTFKFQVTVGDAMDKFNDGKNTMPVTKGIDGGLGTATEEEEEGKPVTNYYFTITSTSDYNKDTKVDASDLFEEYSFTGNMAVNAAKFADAAPGVYHYQVKEIDTGYEGIQYDTTTTYQFSIR